MRIKVGDRVRSSCYGEGTIRELFGINGACVEFDKFMHGHTCNGVCKNGHGWNCAILPKEECEDSKFQSVVAYLVEEEEGWD